MRILFLSNFYPPYAVGGMELTCKSVVDGLGQRGHSVYVLTSHHGLTGPVFEDTIARALHLEMSLASYRNAIDFFLIRNRQTQQNRQHLINSIQNFKPDIVFIWGMWDLQSILAQDAEQIMAGRVLYRFADYWPSLPSQYQQYWDRPGKHPITRWCRKLIRPLAKRLLQKEPPVRLNFPNCYCNSQAAKAHLIQLGIPIEQAPVIYNGLDLSPYAGIEIQSPSGSKRDNRVVFLGRLERVKGLHVAVEAMALIVASNPHTNLRLDIIGDGGIEYVSEIREMVHAKGITDFVNFKGAVPYSQVPEVLSQYQFALVPSIWEDPFPRVAIEAMAAGCVVVGSQIGGLSEIIQHGITGFLHPAGDAYQLAQLLMSLETNPELAGKIALQGQASANQRFNLSSMLDQVEELLSKITNIHPINQVMAG